MIKIKATVTYKVPEWCHCNLMVGLTKASKETCRFCVKTGRGAYSCALHNVPLTVEQGWVVNKCAACANVGRRNRVEVTDDDVKVNPKDIIATVLAEYDKAYKALVAQGFPEAIAVKLAQKSLLGGN